MRRSWISVVLFLSFVVVGAVAKESGAQESSPPKPPGIPVSPTPALAPPSAPSVKPTLAPTLAPRSTPHPAPGSATPYNPTPAQAAPPMYAPQTPVVPTPYYAPPKQTPVECRRVVFRLRAIPAVEAAETLRQMFVVEKNMPASHARVAVVPNVAGNSLLVSGPPNLVKEVGKLIDELDRAPAMVRIEIVIGELGEKDEMEVLSRVELTTLDNQSARLQMGRREPRVTGVQRTSKGTMNSLTFENVGTQLKFTPRVGPDDVVTLEIDLEDSRLGPDAEGAVIAKVTEDETLRMPSTRTLACESTLRIPSGETVTLTGMGRDGEAEKKRVVQVTAEVVKVGGGKG